ncbi:MAG: phosphatidate cytidylyltransferase [Shimia sp.]|uniref:phosphatidate cytidylyltransferase n=1 Tax=Shimia sp. TaxID=1954381 RepID=UPI001B0B88F0|nr:phosphatidate cytidylyltransferase [Shimia sp.]MBO6899361.1 phosphatidate cytidylyltransferase [Shimia sp.]
MTALTLPHVTAAIAAIYTFGFGIIAVLALIPTRRADAAEFGKTLGTAVALIAVLTVLFWVGPYALYLAMPIMVARITFEVDAVRIQSNPRLLHLALFFGGWAFLTMLDPIKKDLAVPLWVVLFAIHLLREEPDRTRGQIVTDLLIFPILPACLLASGTIDPALGPLLLATYLMVEIFDSFALFFGAMWGRTKAFPTLSPNKTVEGLLGGGFALLTLSLITAIALSLPLLPTALTALLVGVLAVVGDLAASRHKRIAGVKDYPQVLPRQGGLLDSLDSWIAAGAGITALHTVAQLW